MASPRNHPWRKYPDAPAKKSVERDEALGWTDKPSDARIENVDSAGEVMRLLEGSNSRKVSVVGMLVEGCEPITYSGTIASLRHLLQRLENRGMKAPELAIISAD